MFRPHSTIFRVGVLMSIACLNVHCLNIYAESVISVWQLIHVLITNKISTGFFSHQKKHIHCLRTILRELCYFCIFL